MSPKGSQTENKRDRERVTELCTSHSLGHFEYSVDGARGAVSPLEMKKLFHSAELTAHSHVAGGKRAGISSGPLAFPSMLGCL